VALLSGSEAEDAEGRAAEEAAAKRKAKGFASMPKRSGQLVRRPADRSLRAKESDKADAERPQGREADAAGTQLRAKAWSMDPGKATWKASAF
jgi:hypothetical protein